MIIYRCITEREIGSIMTEKPTTSHAPKGHNTFSYQPGISYRHFFHFYDSAVLFFENQNTERYYNKYSIIAAYEIPAGIATNYFGYGTYHLQAAKIKDSLLCYFDKLEIPEYAIPEDVLSSCQCVGIGNTNRITSLSKDISQQVINNQKAYLAYLRRQMLRKNNSVRSKTTNK